MKYSKTLCYNCFAEAETLCYMEVFKSFEKVDILWRGVCTSSSPEPAVVVWSAIAYSILPLCHGYAVPPEHYMYMQQKILGQQHDPRIYTQQKAMGGGHN